MTESSVPTAALLIIGNEILSGRTRDVNLNTTATKLAAVGIPLKEVRVIPDTQAEIISSLNALRSRYTYVFTTGGIGPTHDDITVQSVAAAFNVGVIEHPAARALLEEHYGVDKLTDTRLRMARAPVGATLIANPISAAPGLRIENVFVLAGVPNIMAAMLDGIVLSLHHGPAIYSLSVSAYVAESVVADGLAEIASRFPNLDIGSYPWVKAEKFGTALVTRGTDRDQVTKAAHLVLDLVKSKGVEATLSEG